MHDTPVEKEPSGRILLAEDHPVNQRVAKAMLENLGFHVDVVADGAEAVRAATSMPYAVILMDCQLPVLDGCAATREIRRSQGTSARTPVVAVTATATELDHERCVAAGMDDYITKPLSMETLGAVLDRWIPGGSGLDPPVGGVDEGPTVHAGSTHMTEPARPVLDAQIVRRLERLGHEAGEDLMGQLTNMFLADSDASVIALREALAVRDASSVVRIAHALRGASANLGATDLAAFCATMAKDGAAGDLSGGETLLGTVEVELERVRSALGSRVPAR